MPRFFWIALSFFMILSCKAKRGQSHLSEAVEPSSDAFNKSYSTAMLFFSDGARDALKSILVNSNDAAELGTALTYFQANPVADSTDAAELTNAFVRICRMNNTNLISSLAMTVGLQHSPGHKLGGDGSIMECLQQQQSAGLLDRASLDWIAFRKNAAAVALDTYPNPQAATLTTSTANANENLIGRYMPILVGETAFASTPDRAKRLALGARMGEYLEAEYNSLKDRIAAPGIPASDDIQSLMMVLAKYQLLDSGNTASGGNSLIPAVWNGAITASKALWKLSAKLKTDTAKDRDSYLGFAISGDLAQQKGIACPYPDAGSCYFSTDKSLSQYIINQTASDLTGLDLARLTFAPEMSLNTYLINWLNFLKTNICGTSTTNPCNADPKRPHTFRFIWATTNESFFKDGSGKWLSPSNLNQINGAYANFELLTDQIRNLVSTGGYGGGRAFNVDPFMINNPAIGAFLEATLAPVVMSVATMNTVSKDQAYLLLRFFEGFEYTRLLMQDGPFTANIGDSIRNAFKTMASLGAQEIPLLYPTTVQQPVVWEFCNILIPRNNLSFKDEQLNMYARILFTHPYFYRIGTQASAAGAGLDKDFTKFQVEMSNTIRSIPIACDEDNNPDDTALSFLTNGSANDLVLKVGNFYAINPDSLLSGTENLILKGDRASYLNRTTMTKKLP